MIGLAGNKDQIEDEIQRLKEEVKVLSQKGTERIPEDALPSTLIKYLIEERERTNRVLSGLTERLKELEQRLSGYEVVETGEVQAPAMQMGLMELPVSNLDANILDLVKSKGMVCADDVKNFMNYRGRNAACNRLNRLCTLGFLTKSQLGHRVYYRIDAGKATKALIISPPQ